MKPQILMKKDTEKVLTLSRNFPRFPGQKVIFFDDGHPLIMIRKTVFKSLESSYLTTHYL